MAASISSSHLHRARRHPRRRLTYVAAVGRHRGPGLPASLPSETDGAVALGALGVQLATLIWDPVSDYTNMLLVGCLKPLTWYLR